MWVLGDLPAAALFLVEAGGEVVLAGEDGCVFAGRPFGALRELGCGPRGISGLSSDESFVYWSTRGALRGRPEKPAVAPEDGHVLRVARSGGMPEVIATGHDPEHLLAAGDTLLFWDVVWSASSHRPPESFLRAVRPAGVTDLMMAHGLPLAPVAASTGWFAVVGDYSPISDELWEIPTAGTPTHRFEIGGFELAAGGLAADGEHLHVSASVPGAGYKLLRLTPGAPGSEVSFSVRTRPTEIQVDETNLYWFERTSEWDEIGDIRFVPKSAL